LFAVVQCGLAYFLTTKYEMINSFLGSSDLKVSEMEDWAESGEDENDRSDDEGNDDDKADKKKKGAKGKGKGKAAKKEERFRRRGVGRF